MLSANHVLRKEQERREQEMGEAQKLQKVLEAGSSDAAVEAALAVIRKRKPDLLKE